jgi:hypothetical protein
MVGAAAGASVPPADALVASLKTTLRSRSGRGRIFIPGISASLLDTHGAWTATAQAYFQTATFDIKVDLNSGVTPADLVVASRKLADFFSVQSVSVKTNVRTQRRRELDH